MRPSPRSLRAMYFASLASKSGLEVEKWLTPPNGRV